MWQNKKVIEISNEKAKETFADIMLMTLKCELEWKLLAVAYLTNILIRFLVWLADIVLPVTAFLGFISPLEGKY